MKALQRTLLFASIVSLALASCGGGQPALQEITLETKDIAFGTTTLEATAGQPVRLTLNNTGALDHDFSIMEIPVANVSEHSDETAGHDMSHMTDVPVVHVAVGPGASATVEFTPTTPGIYEFVCTTAGHLEAGMTGTLIVKEP